jgi:hypothetical protein
VVVLSGENISNLTPEKIREYLKASGKKLPVSKITPHENNSKLQIWTLLLNFSTRTIEQSISGSGNRGPFTTFNN